MKNISEILFLISNGLLIPVVILLLLLLVMSLWYVIGFYHEYRVRQKISSVLKNVVAEYSQEKVESALEEIKDAGNNHVETYLQRIAAHGNDKAYCEHELQNFRIEIQHILSKYRIFIKFGPMLGLMGTLIPMGPALVGLAVGDIASMAYNMQVAFATTVVGMATAAIGMLLLQAAKRFYAHAFNDLEFITCKLNGI